MKIHLVSGGCGFVGKNMVRRLYQSTTDTILFVDNLLVGEHPDQWLELEKTDQRDDLLVYGESGRLLFLEQDFRYLLRHMIDDPRYLQNKYGLSFDRFEDVFHFAAIVGGRAMIDGDPMTVALDLSIDAEFFYWVTKHKPARVLYPSSSAAYPVDLQTEDGAIALSESDINFKKMGQPDMTYGWSKLTGEFLAQITAKHYGVSVTCIRPFSGYGEDQNLTYPVPAIADRVARREDPIEVWGTGHQGRDFVHIDDVVDCILMAMDQIKDGSAINIGMGRLTSFIEIIHELTDIAGYKPQIKQLLDKPVGVHARYANMEHVKNEIGWEAKISIREGLTRMYHKALQRNKNK